MSDFTKMENVSAALGLPSVCQAENPTLEPITGIPGLGRPVESKALTALRVAKQTIDGWTRDSEGRVTVHPDVVSKAVNAAIAALEERPTGECGQSDRDAALLRNLEPDIIYYGPHPCENCGKTICRVSREQGGMAFDYPEGIIYPNTNWAVHVCERGSQGGSRP